MSLFGLFVPYRVQKQLLQILSAYNVAKVYTVLDISWFLGSESSVSTRSAISLEMMPWQSSSACETHCIIPLDTVTAASFRYTLLVDVQWSSRLLRSGTQHSTFPCLVRRLSKACLRPQFGWDVQKIKSHMEFSARKLSSCRLLESTISQVDVTIFGLMSRLLRILLLLSEFTTHCFMIVNGEKFVPHITRSNFFLRVCCE